MRELAQAVAFRLGTRQLRADTRAEWHWEADFISIGVFSIGTTIRSLRRAASLALSGLGSQFVAGILYHLPALCCRHHAVGGSYYRLRPNRWAPVQTDAHARPRRGCAHLSRFSATMPLIAPGSSISNFVSPMPLQTLTSDSRWMSGWARRRPMSAGNRHGCLTALPLSGRGADVPREQRDGRGMVGRRALSAYLLFKRQRSKEPRWFWIKRERVCHRYAEAY